MSTMSDVTVIRGGTIVDGTGAPGVRADVAITSGKVSEIGPGLDGERTLDAGGHVVAPGFIDIHTHYDAQVFWDPYCTLSGWHGVTSVVLGNCGVTFAPCKPEDREYLAEMMESVEDIPAASILDGLSWQWKTYGEYLAELDRLPKGVNVGGMVGHCAVRHWAMGERGLDETPASADDIAAMTALVNEAIGAGALGFSTSRTMLHRVPDGRAVPGTYAAPDELLALGDVLGRGPVREGGVDRRPEQLGVGEDGQGLERAQARQQHGATLARRCNAPLSMPGRRHGGAPEEITERYRGRVSRATRAGGVRSRPVRPRPRPPTAPAASSAGRRRTPHRTR